MRRADPRRKRIGAMHQCQSREVDQLNGPTNLERFGADALRARFSRADAPVTSDQARSRGGPRLHEPDHPQPTVESTVRQSERPRLACPSRPGRHARSAANPGQEPIPASGAAVATALEHDDPVLVGHRRRPAPAAAEGDISGGPRGSAADVRRLHGTDHRAAGARHSPSPGHFGLEHIVEDLLDGMTVDGVRGIGTDGTALPPPVVRHCAPLREKDLRAARFVVLVVEASVVEGHGVLGSSTSGPLGRASSSSRAP